MYHFTFITPPKCKKYTDLQITRNQKDANWYRQRSQLEFQAIKNYLGRPATIMELGCGMGRMSIFINAQLQDPAIHYILADTTQITHQKNLDQWDPGKEYYNDLQLTDIFAKANGMTHYQTFDIQQDNWSKLKPVDLFMSFLAVGWHYPIENELDRLLEIASDHCTMIFGVRKEKYDDQSFKNHFKQVQLIDTFINPQYSMLILKR